MPARRVLLLGTWLALIAAAPATAFEFFDGRLQIHGFYEGQVRGISRNYSEELDLTQWQNILNLEIEHDFAPNGWWVFDVISGYVRAEVRYDCVWTHGCTIFESANAYGHRSRDGKLPLRLLDGRRDGFSATMFTGDTRRYYGIPFDELGNPDSGNGQQKPIRLFQDPAYYRQFDTSPGVDGVFDPFGKVCPLPSMGCDPKPPFTDDPGPNVMRKFMDCLYGAQSTRGGTNGQGRRDLLLGIDDCKVIPTGSLNDIPNPFRGAVSPVFGPRPDGGDFAPWIGSVGSGELPYRPAPMLNYAVDANRDRAKGIYYPPERLARLKRKDAFSSPQQNFRESALAFNRGASQQRTKELKESYLDLELFQGRLWLRLGKQSIVWGKTELFRTTDQFNPQDLALSSLPSLEESRIALFSGRAVWSFYDVGPFQDVRFEVAANYDKFEPSDLGRCGEPYTLSLVCQGAFGLHVHGILGLGVAGAERPESPWHDVSGVEVGGRFEWRWDRFSFALSDFYGYQDFPTVEQIFRYSRNVDPRTGYPRHTESQAGCDPDDQFGGDTSGCLLAEDALELQSANQQIFAWICGMTAGVTELDPASCGNTIFNSQNQLAQGSIVLPATLAEFATALFAGNEGAAAFAQFNFGVNLPRLQPNADPNDGPGAADFFYRPGIPGFQTVSSTLTDQQEALLGCGPIFDIVCDTDGVDLLNMEASVLFQAWPGFEGTFYDWTTTDASVAQPGTVGFVGGPVATRYVDGQTFIVPGARGPTYQNANSPFDAGIDGCTSAADSPDSDPTYCLPNGTGTNGRTLIHPFFDPSSPFYQGVASPFPQQFINELGAVSFNALMFFVGFSGQAAGVQPDDPEVIDPNDPFSTQRCSFAKPQLCLAVKGAIDFTGVQRSTVRAGGRNGFGRRDFVWHIGTPLLVKFDKRNTLGFSMDWAEDVTKSNWSLEATWMDDQPSFDSNQPSGIREVDTYNLTVSADRPTFINFLNPNRTFFFNTQWFFQYINGYRHSFTGNGPWNVFFTFTTQTGYFQDRLLPSMTWVYDFRSSSGAYLPSLTYRFTENFSATFGLATFWGRTQYKLSRLVQAGRAERIGRHADKTGADNGLSAIRERDEVYLRVKYTF